MSAESPQQIGPYEIRGELGRGGMGVVYRAHRPDLKKDYALKVMLPGQDASQDAIARFRREAQAAAQLGSHPGIVACHDIGEDDGRVYFAMDLVEGSALEQLIDEGDLTLEQSGRLIEQAARALHFAHANGILHRDIKPGNLLVTPDGEARVADFGLAGTQEADAQSTRLTKSGMVLGTAAYMSPEQARGETLDARTDVYALGATLYECLVSSPPFGGGSIYEVLAKLLGDEPKPPRRRDPRIPRDLDTITLKCLEKAPERRYQTAEALATDLARWRNGEPITARPASAGYRLRKWLGRHRLAVRMSATTSLLAGVVVGAAVIPGWISERRARESYQRGFAAQREREFRELKAREAARPSLTAGHRLLLRIRLRQRAPDHTQDDVTKLVLAAEAKFMRALEACPKLPEAWLGIGQAWSLANDKRRARTAIDLAIELEPTYATAFLDRVRSRLEDYEDLVHRAGTKGQGTTRPETKRATALRLAIEADLVSVRKHSMEDAELRYADALLAFAKGDYRAAAEGLSRYLELAPDDARAHYWRGHSLYHLGRHADAIEALDRAVAGDRRDHVALAYRGEVWAHSGDFARAIAEFTQAIAIKPTVSAFVGRGSAWADAGDVKKAVADYTRAIERDPTVVAAYLNRGDVWIEARKIDQAVQDFTRAMELEPNRVRGLLRRGRAWIEKGDLDRARSDYARAIERSPGNAQAHHDRAIVASLLNNHARAVAGYTRAIDLREAYAEAYSNRGISLNALRDHARALSDHVRAVELEPHVGKWLLRRGTARHLTGDGNGAIADYSQALEIGAGDTSVPFFRDQAHFNRGRVLFEQRQYARALPDLSEAIKLNPKLLRAYLNRALCHGSIGNRRAALADFDRTLELAPRDWPRREQVEGWRAQVVESLALGGSGR